MNLHLLLKALQDYAYLCDGCLSKLSGVKPSNSVNQTCHKHSDLILRHKHEDAVQCSFCKSSNKITSSLATFNLGIRQANESVLVDALWAGELTQNDPRGADTLAAQDAFSRSRYLKHYFNQTIAQTLQIPEGDYMERLDLDGLISLKAIMSNVHATITVRLTLALAEWLGKRMGFTEDQIKQIKSSIDSSKPFESGFDVDVADPNIIGEIKGNIPNGDKPLFKSAQLKGLTNDVRQMFGLEPVDKSVSTRSKIYRAARKEALKFLGVYDSLSVRTAAAKWIASFKRSHPLLNLEICHDSTVFSPDTVYIVFLKLDAAILEPTEIITD